MRLLVTGAGGFVGRYLIQRAKRDFPGVDVLATGHAGHANGDDDVRGLDVTNQAAVQNAVRAFQPTHIVHLAAVSNTTIAARDQEKAWDVNLSGTLHVLRAVERECPDACVLFISSGEVYGARQLSGVPTTEDVPCSPVTVYAATKCAGEAAVCEMASRGFRFFIARPFNHIGAGQEAKFAVPAFAAQIARIERGEQKPQLHVGSLDAVRDFLDVRDVVAAYCAILERSDSLVPGTTLNIASGIGRSIGEIVESLVGLAACKIEITTDPSRVRLGERRWSVGDAAKAHRLLKWQPRRDLGATLRWVLDDWRGAPGGDPAALSAG